MDDWRQLLRGFLPRADRKETFYAETVELEHPVLLNRNDVVGTAFVAARILRAVAERGGTQVRPSHLESLEKLLRRGLTPEATHHAEAEAERVLRWLVDPPAREEQLPELELMLDADLEARRSVARFALDEGYDLELEHYDEADELWYRRRVALLEIDGDDLEVRHVDEHLSIALRYVRWLMPVPPRDEDPDGPEGGGGRILKFPGA